MINTQTIKLTKTKELIFAAIFVALSVLTPMIFHYFGGVGAGRALLPMHFFVLVAGLLLGWRAGLAVGLASPLISYLIVGMPVASVLPFIVVELSVYGLIAGALRQKYNIFISLIGALVVGRLLVGIVMFLFSDTNAVNYVLSALKAGWRGIILQIIFIPIIVKKLYQYFRNGEL